MYEDSEQKFMTFRSPWNIKFVTYDVPPKSTWLKLMKAKDSIA